MVPFPWDKTSKKPQNQQPDFWGSFAKTSKDIEKNINTVVGQASQAATETVKWAEESISQAVSNFTQDNNEESFDLTKVPETKRLAFYGALFAIASADGTIEKEEVEFIFGIMDLQGISETAKRQAQSYLINPPPLSDCLKELSQADERLRYGVMFNLIDTAWANDEFSPEEEKAIHLAQKELKVSDEQVQAIQTFIIKIRQIRARGLDDNQAADAIKNATAGLSAVGVPIAAVFFSGSVLGLSAAGITSGLAALGALVGLGGMLPGIGVAILLGTGIFVGVNTLLDTGDKRQKEQLQAARERQAQLIIENLQGALSEIVARVDQLQKAAADAEANREALRILSQKMRILQQLIQKRKQASSQ